MSSKGEGMQSAAAASGDGAASVAAAAPAAGDDRAANNGGHGTAATSSTTREKKLLLLLKRKQAELSQLQAAHEQLQQQVRSNSAATDEGGGDNTASSAQRSSGGDDSACEEELQRLREEVRAAQQKAAETEGRLAAAESMAENELSMLNARNAKLLQLSKDARAKQARADTEVTQAREAQDLALEQLAQATEQLQDLREQLQTVPPRTQELAAQLHTARTAREQLDCRALDELRARTEELNAARLSEQAMASQLVELQQLVHTQQEEADAALQGQQQQHEQALHELEEAHALALLRKHTQQEDALHQQEEAHTLALQQLRQKHEHAMNQEQEAHALSVQEQQREAQAQLQSETARLEEQLQELKEQLATANCNAATAVALDAGAAPLSEIEVKTTLARLPSFHVWLREDELKRLADSKELLQEHDDGAHAGITSARGVASDTADDDDASKPVNHAGAVLEFLMQQIEKEKDKEQQQQPRHEPHSEQEEAAAAPSQSTSVFGSPADLALGADATSLSRGGLHLHLQQPQQDETLHDYSPGQRSHDSAPRREDESWQGSDISLQALLETGPAAPSASADANAKNVHPLQEQQQQYAAALEVQLAASQEQATRLQQLLSQRDDACVAAEERAARTTASLAHARQLLRQTIGFGAMDNATLAQKYLRFEQAIDDELQADNRAIASEVATTPRLLSTVGSPITSSSATAARDDEQQQSPSIVAQAGQALYRLLNSGASLSFSDTPATPTRPAGAESAADESLGSPGANGTYEDGELASDVNVSDLQGVMAQLNHLDLLVAQGQVGKEQVATQRDMLLKTAAYNSMLASRKSEQQLVAAKRASQAAKDELVELQGQYEHTEKQRRKLEEKLKRVADDQKLRQQAEEETVNHLCAQLSELQVKVERVTKEKEQAQSHLQAHLQLAQLRSLLEAGVIDQAEFQRMQELTVQTSDCVTARLEHPPLT